MTGPSPRPTREEEEAALRFADEGTHPTAVVLAAVVRAQREELDRVHSALRHESDAHVAERDRLRAALAARTPQPAEQARGICGDRLSSLAGQGPYFCDLPAGHQGWHQSQDGPRWSFDPERELARPAPQPAVPDGPVPEISQARKDWIAQVAPVWLGAPVGDVETASAVPDGEDVGRLRAELAEVRRAADEHPDVPHRELIAELRRLVDNDDHCTETHREPEANDLPQRMHRAADSCANLRLTPYSREAGQLLRRLASWLEHADAAEVRAAVAAALARAPREETAMPDAPGYERIAEAIETAFDVACIEVVVTHGGQPAGLYNVARCLDKAGLIDWSAFDEEAAVER